MTIWELEVEAGIPVERWYGKCYLVAMAAMRRLRWQAELVTGYYDDGENVTDHGWLKLDDGRICDPTRWTMQEGRKPYIYIGEPTTEYDEEGKRWEAELEALRPVIPEYNLAEAFK